MNILLSTTKYFSGFFVTVGTLVLSTSLTAQDLTETGAEKKATPTGRVPKWADAPASFEQGWEVGMNRVDYWKYRDEPPIQTITSGNVESYAKHLPPGQVALLRSMPTYAVQVYPSRRDCGLPEFVRENTRMGKGRARIGSDGWSLEGALLPSVPFPEPRSGIEAIWNFLVRYQGTNIHLPEGSVLVSPPPGHTSFIDVSYEQRMYFPWGAKGEVSSDQAPFYGGIFYAYKDPPAMAGQAVVQRLYFNKSSEAFYYFPGQRRVRRLPAYAYDSPLLGFEKMYPVDASFVFYGNPDRFEWRLLGKREMIVPYNGFKLLDAKSSFDEHYGTRHIQNRARRYEYHRVWVIEGILKPGFRHSSPRKVLYLDEDSWNAVFGEDYDETGRLTRVKEAAPVPMWEIGTCSTTASLVMYDLVRHRYLRDGAPKNGKSISFLDKETSVWSQQETYTAEGLKRESDR